MRPSSKTNKRKYAALLLIVFSNIAVYGLVYMKTAMYDIMLEATGLNHFEISNLFAVYGMVGMGAYLFGGILSDIFSAKKILVTALTLSGILHLYFAVLPDYPHMVAVFALMGFTSIFAFFPASTKTLTELSDQEDMGKIFGIYYSLVLLFSGIILVAVVVLLESFNDAKRVFQCSLVLYGILNFVSAVGLQFALRDVSERRHQCSKLQRAEIAVILKNSKVWLAALIMMSNFVLVDCLTYINPFMKRFYAVSDSRLLVISIFRAYVFATLCGPVYGWITDRVQSVTRVMKYGFIISLIGLIPMAVSGIYRTGYLQLLIFVFLLTVNVAGLKGVSIVIVPSLKLPKQYLGTALGIVSFIGYSPDAFFYPVAGFMINSFSSEGYAMIFILCMFFCIVGFCAAQGLEKKQFHSERSSAL